MGLFSRERDEASSDQAAAPSRWRIASFGNAGDGRKAKRPRHVFSIWSAMKYTMILSILLWWLPVFGQMIAGYVGGRKAGSPWKGIIAAILPVVALFAVITGLDYALSHNLTGSGTTTTSLLAGFASGLPIVGPYLDFTREYVVRFIDSLAGSAPYGLNSYIITLAFAYIGGILADQTRREIEAISGSAGSHMTVVVAPNDGQEFRQYDPRRIVPAVSDFVSGRNSLWSLHHKGHGPRVTSFDQLVPEGSSGERFETDSILGIERRRPLSRREEKKEAKAAAKRTRKVRGINAPRVDEPRRKPSLKINSQNPRTMKAAQRRIEREWNPDKRKRHERTPMPHQKPGFDHSKMHSVDQPVATRTARKRPSRSWETI